MDIDEMFGVGKCHTCGVRLPIGVKCTETSYRDSWGRWKTYHTCLKCSIKEARKELREHRHLIQSLRRLHKQRQNERTFDSNRRTK
jgi:hypothetical protein